MRVTWRLGVGSGDDSGYVGKWYDGGDNVASTLAVCNRGILSILMYISSYLRRTLVYGG